MNRSRVRQAAPWAVTIFAVLALVAGAALTVARDANARATSSADGTCLDTEWVQQSLAELEPLVPEGATFAEAQSIHEPCPYTSPQWDFLDDRPISAALREVFAKAEQQGWTLVEGQPWYGCRYKVIDSEGTHLQALFQGPNSGYPTFSIWASTADRACKRTPKNPDTQVKWTDPRTS